MKTYLFLMLWSLLSLAAVPGYSQERDSRSLGSDTGLLLDETFEDNRHGWRLSANQFNAEIRNGAIRFVTGSSVKGGPSLVLEQPDLYSFELEYSLQADHAGTLQAMLLDSEGSNGLVFGLDKGKPFLALRAGSLFGPSERNLSQQLTAAPLRSGYNRFAIHRLGNTLRCLINGTSVLYLSLDHGRFGKLKGLMLVSGRRGVTVTADDIRLRRRTVDMQVDQITVQATTRQDRIVFHEPATLVFHMRNNGDYPLFRQHFELIPADRNRDRIHIGRAVDSIGQIEPGQTFAVTFELSAGLVLPADSVRFRLCTPLHGDWQRIPVAVATVSLFDAVRPSLPDPDDARQRAVLRHYGRPGVDIGKCVSALRALSGADPMARAWEGMLTSLGQGGFQRDEEAGRWLLRESLPALQAAVLRGEVEAMFLLGNAWWLGLGTAEEAAFAPELLAYAADQGYAPAVLDYGMYQAGRQSYEVGRALLREAYEMGLQKALTYRGILEELDPGSDETPATEWFRQAAAAGDPAAMVLLAERMREDTTGLGRDKAAPDRWLAKAAALGHTGAMRVLSRWYFDGIGSQGRKVAEAVRWLTKAAEGGDRDAMLSLGMLRLEGSLAGGVDTQQGFAWVRQAAEQGQPVAMRLLGGMYAEGAIVAHDPVRSRYWLNQAAGRGEGAGAAQTQQIHPLAAMLDNVVWVEEYQVTNDGRGSTGEVRYVGTDYAASFIQTVLEAYGASRSAPMQEQLNGLVPIRKAGGVDIYAATVASHFRSQLRLPAGGTVVATASGEVQAGFVHRCGPGGHADPYVQAYNYPDAGDILHAALMYRIGEGPWSLLGPGVSFQVPADGLLELAVNDRDYTNNKGYFDVVLAVR